MLPTNYHHGLPFLPSFGTYSQSLSLSAGKYVWHVEHLQARTPSHQLIVLGIGINNYYHRYDALASIISRDERKGEAV